MNDSRIIMAVIGAIVSGLFYWWIDRVSDEMIQQGRQLAALEQIVENNTDAIIATNKSIDDITDLKVSNGQILTRLDAVGETLISLTALVRRRVMEDETR